MAYSLHEDFDPMLVVQTATYNEAESIEQLIDQIQSAVPEAHVLVVDDNSPDGTGKIVSELMTKNDALHLVERFGRRGLGSAILEGLRASESIGAEIVVYMDADLSHNPLDIPRLLQALNSSNGYRFDIAIGSRRITGGQIIGWSGRRQVASFLVNMFSRFVLWIPVHDASSGFRAIRLQVVKDMDLLNISVWYAFQEDFLWRAYRAGARMTEVPVTFINRKIGASKVDRKEIFRSSLALLRIARHTWLGF